MPIRARKACSSAAPSRAASSACARNGTAPITASMQRRAASSSSGASSRRVPLSCRRLLAAVAERRPPALMLQGTGSDVGKSLLLAGLARAFARQGLAVRPFKPQNMSNNAAVTEDGGEIGRAQALQARACFVTPSVHMNPVLLKPESESGAQLVVQGRVAGRTGAAEYHRVKAGLMEPVLDSFRRLSAEADLLLVEGAGSTAEVNLRAGDIANMGFAEAADLPVLLVADIERGGAIAAI